MLSFVAQLETRSSGLFASAIVRPALALTLVIVAWMILLLFAPGLSGNDDNSTAYRTRPVGKPVQSLYFLRPISAMMPSRMLPSRPWLMAVGAA